jgi:hypothetical protein
MSFPCRAVSALQSSPWMHEGTPGVFAIVPVVVVFAAAYRQFRSHRVHWHRRRYLHSESAAPLENAMLLT